MKKFVEDTLEFVCKAYTFLNPAVYTMFALASIYIALFFNPNSLIGGVFISVNILHIIVGSIFLRGADNWWDMKVEQSLINGFVIYLVIGLCIWASPMTITDWMYGVYLVNGVALGMNAATAKS